MLDAVAIVKGLIHDTLSLAQETLLATLYGLSLSAPQRAVYSLATGNANYIAQEYREALIICGRKSGKSSKVAANIAVIEALFRQHALAPGERGHVVVIAPTKRQARVCFQYIIARLESAPELRAMILGNPRDEEVDLINGITISTMVASIRTVRGFSCVCVILDEEAFFYDSETNANPCSEILRAIRPSMATFPSAKLIRVSSPFAKVGNLYETWRDRAKHPEILVWRLETRLMNPSLEAFLDAEERRDGEAYQREYACEFVDSAAAFLPAEKVEGCVVPGRISMAANPAACEYTAAIDFGFRRDRTAFTVVHKVGDKVIQDYITVWKPTRSEPVELLEVLGDVVQILANYGCGVVYGDSFCGEPTRQLLREKGIDYVETTTLGRGAVALWSTFREMVLAQRIEFVDDKETIEELKRLQVISSAGGGQRVEAAGSAHDDRAVVTALACWAAVAHASAEPWAEVISVPSGPSSLAQPSLAQPEGSTGPPRRIPLQDLDPSDDGPSRWWSNF